MPATTAMLCAARDHGYDPATSALTSWRSGGRPEGLGDSCGFSEGEEALGKRRCWTSPTLWAREDARKSGIIPGIESTSVGASRAGEMPTAAIVKRIWAGPRLQFHPVREPSDGEPVRVTETRGSRGRERDMVASST